MTETRRILIRAALVGLLFALPAVALAEEPKPTLTVWTTKSCAPCKQFADDYRLDAEFRRALDAHYRVVWKSWERDREEFEKHDVDRVPTFFDGSPEQRVIGYASPEPDQTAAAWFLVQLGIKGPPMRMVPQRSVPPQAAQQRAGCGCREEFARIASQLAELRREIASNRAAVNAAADWINSDTAGAELTELRGRLNTLAEQLQTIEQTPGPSGERGPPGPRGPPGEPGPARSVTVIFEDDAGNRLAAPVVIPPEASRVRVPVERFVRD